MYSGGMTNETTTTEGIKMLTWTPIANGLKATAGDRAYYISNAGGVIDVSFRDTTAEPVIRRGRKEYPLTHVQFGDISDIS